MEKPHNIDNLITARELLKNSVETTKRIAVTIDETGLRLQETGKNLALVQDSIKDISSKCTFHKIGVHVDRAIGPATAVLKVLDLVYELEDSLKTDHPNIDLYAYLTTIRKLEDAIKLLTSNCSLVIMWLQDVIQFLENNKDDWYFAKVDKIMKILFELLFYGQTGEVLSLALNKLETEYRRLLTEIPVLPSYEEDMTIVPSSFQMHLVQDLQAITAILVANNRIDKCVSIYAKVRIVKIRASLKALDLDYLDIHVSEFDDMETLEGYIGHWDNHMEFLVRRLLQKEYKLCSEVYQKAGSDILMKCFSKISTQCGFLDILNFGNTISESKKEAIKLLKLLKIFATLDRLRVDFNELFNGEFCIKIQNRTRELVKKVVYGTCEIFWELLVQVELQRVSPPPPDGSVPLLVHFMSGYCNRLLQEENRSLLIRVLEIYQVWNNLEFNEEVLGNEIRNIMKALEINLETWAKMYDNNAVSYIFIMNIHRYFCNKVGNTRLGVLMGHSWYLEHEGSVEYYAEQYIHESWGKLLVFLSEEDLVLFPGGRAFDRNLVKKRISIFCDAFDDIYKKQSKWILHDEELRRKICHLVVEAIVSPYKRFLQRFMHEHEADLGKNVKYNAKNLENLLGSLFQPKTGKYGGSNCTDLIEIKHGVISHFSFTPAAA